MPNVPPKSFKTLLKEHEMISYLVKRLTSSTSKPSDETSKPTDKIISSLLIEELDNHKNSITAHLKSIPSYSDGLSDKEDRRRTLLDDMLEQVEQHIENTKTHVDQQQSDHKDSVRNDDVISTTYSPMHGKND